MPKKQRRKALFGALTIKAKDNEIKGYEDFEGIEEEWEDFNQSKTKSKSK